MIFPSENKTSEINVTSNFHSGPELAPASEEFNYLPFLMATGLVSVVALITVISKVAIGRKRNCDDSGLVANFTNAENGHEVTLDAKSGEENRISYAEAILEENQYYDQAGSFPGGDDYAIDTVNVNDYYE